MAVPPTATLTGRRPLPLRCLAAIAVLVVACSPGATATPRSTAAARSPSADASPAASAPPTPTAPPNGTITLYTSVQQPVVDAVLAAFRTAQPDVTVELFRAPTGELSARMAAELRDGRVQADLLWLTDPLSMQSWAAQDVLRSWAPANAAALDASDRTDTFWGTRLINIVIVKGTAVTPGPVDWKDLTDAAYRDSVALPDPGFAGSAFGALGWFALAPGYGLEYYEALKANGTVQLKSPDEVTTGVAEGRFSAGITLDSSVRAAAAKGSPVELVWPTSGAIALYGPVGVVDASENPTAAEAFVEFLLSAEGQAALGGAGQEPIIAGNGGPAPEGAQVKPDWPAVFGRQEQLLEQYRAIFGG